MNCPQTVEEAKALGYKPIGFVVDPDRLRFYIPKLFVAADGKCWALIERKSVKEIERD